MDYAKAEEIIRQQRRQELDDEINIIWANNAPGLNFFVHDGAQLVRVSFCGNPFDEKNFSLTECFNCRGLPVSIWRSPTPIKAGEFVRNVGGNGVRLHMVIAAKTLKEGYTVGYSVPFADVPGYKGGVGQQGLQPPVGPQFSFN